MRQARTKIEHFAARGLSGMAYVAQVGFLLIARDSSLVHRARLALAEHSELPESRFLLATPSNLALHPTAAIKSNMAAAGERGR